MVFQIITPARIGSEYWDIEIESAAVVACVIQESLIYAIYCTVATN